MPRYALLLRGVNVGGVKVKMADLRALLEGAGYTDVKTLLASGNALVDADVTRGAAPRVVAGVAAGAAAGAGADGTMAAKVDGAAAAIRRDVEARLSKRYGRDMAVVAIELERLRELTDAYPFGEATPDRTAYVVLSSAPAELPELLRFAGDLEDGVERVRAGDGVLYWEVARGHTLDSAFGRATARWPERRTITVRNLNTLRKLGA